MLLAAACAGRDVDWIYYTKAIGFSLHAQPQMSRTLIVCSIYSRYYYYYEGNTKFGSTCIEIRI
jgi:hypothetical protein